MATVNPLPRPQAAEEAQPIYDALTKAYGKMPNMFGVMAHRPSVLKHFMPFYAAVMRAGTVEPRYKELAYLEASTLNGCEY
ncbi:MAG: carboxymuconolactone decarboxylase family protein [Candidatus Rokubacteria bacterium]|nr:carboxymuconolactone decarboxylase family protein [Candidatus Rokubacteria bacterium]